MHFALDQKMKYEIMIHFQSRFADFSLISIVKKNASQLLSFSIVKWLNNNFKSLQKVCKSGCI